MFVRVADARRYDEIPGDIAGNKKVCSILLLCNMLLVTKYLVFSTMSPFLQSDIVYNYRLVLT